MPRLPDPAQLRPVLGRFGRHLTRALHAVRRAGPGRHAGWVAGVEVDDDRVCAFGEVHVAGEVFDLVVVRIGDRIVGWGAVDRPTPALAALRPGEHGADQAGWSVCVPRAGLPTGVVTVDADAYSRSGLVERLDPLRIHLAETIAPAPVTGRETSIVGHLDAPAEGATEADGIVVVRGWVAPAVAVDRVEVTFDDGAIGVARVFGSGRDDITRHLYDPTAVLAGFELVRAVRAPAGRETSFRVEAIGPAGRVALGERRVTVLPTAPLGEADARWVDALVARNASLAETVVPTHELSLVVITHDLGLGGAQLWLDEILDRLLAEPDVVCTVLSQRDGPLRARLEAAGARVAVIGKLPLHAGEYETAVADLVRLFAVERASVVLANTMGCFIGVDAASRAGLPSILAIHEHFDLDEFWPAAFGRGAVDAHVRTRGRAALDHASLVAFVADATRAAYTAHSTSDRLLHIGYGIPVSEADGARAGLDRAALRAAHDLRDHHTLLVEIATVEPRKAQSNLVLALARLAPDHPDLRLALVGGADGEYARLVRRLADELGLGERVRIVPLTEDVAPWLVMADAFVLPSDVESLPRSILEAMAFGVPVVATTAGGVTELVTDGVTGITCEPRDVGALAAAIGRLLEMDDADRRSMTTAAAARVRRDHDVTEYPRTFVRLVRGLVKDPTAHPRELLAEP